MASELEMPKLSDTMTEGTILRWLKKEGDAVEIGDEIAEIETDKATMAMEVFDEGILSKIMVQEGEKAAVGAVIGILGDEGEDVSDSGSSSKPAETPAPAEEKKEASPAPAASSPAQAPAPAAPASSDGSRLRVSPLARKIAEEKGVDLTTLTGSGPSGRIVKKDVEAAGSGSAKPAASSSAPAAAAAPAAKAIVPAAASGEDQRIELSTMRKIIADRLLTSKVTIPHFYLHVEVDAAPLMSLRKQINEQAEKTTGNKYTINDFIVKALINASVAVPQVNASFAGDHIVQYASVGVSVAVAVDDGLVTPVVKNAETKSLLQISREIKDIAARSRDKKLRPDEFDGGTVTISNLGSYGIDSFDAIVNPPQAIILSVGNIVKKPVVVGDEIKPGLRLNLGLSCDHRVVDGAVGAQFLAEMKKLIENPALMLV
ncbi:pyruvate dehydrogenase complex dihydrolipoamide acetyltransferase [Roseibacillus persicicus]|uniref:Acetyltransferase component of pyruvate dehydrogenase complex n=1 Tax=Roseibacillus persicicus TaxID=454148 RepID=A0A918WJ14_9BACT|nr:pyruvate dehydrogenase complex dihydrolipoamide acetyltransferase [Roseibacillus persicicus]GHC50300.1 acetyltransferase component of pyruvate dehydrogenase complex [Roseibacillus persicicus]